MRLILATAAAMLASAAAAQTPPAPTPRPPGLSEADLAMVLTVQADTLRFERAPLGDFTLTVEPGVVLDKLERGGLPRPVQPGVTYRDIHLRYEGAAEIVDPAEPAEPAPAEPEATQAQP